MTDLSNIAIDPGHPPRGTAAPGLIESVYVWEMALFLAARISHSGEPFRVTLLRNAVDESISLEERGARSAACGADLVLHLHVNASTNPRQRGAECYYWPGNEIGREVSDAILRAYPVPMYVSGRTATAAFDRPGPGDDWIRNARAVMWPHAATSCLVELGYATHEVDRRALLEPATQSGIVAALVCGLARYRQLREDGGV